MNNTLSSFQESILDEAAQGTNLAIHAKAGCGKSTMLELLTKQAMTKQSLVLAFNKHNANEIKPKIHGDVKTLHSLGLQLLTQTSSKKTKVNQNKILSLAKQLKIPAKQRVDFEVFWNAYRLSAAHPNSDAWKAIVQNFCSFTIDSYYNEVEAVEEANMSLWLNDGILDFVDMLWLPTRIDYMKTIPYDLVAIDEAHDISPIGLDLLERVVSTQTQVVTCTDPDQRIYTSLNMLHYENLEESKVRWQCKEFPLPLSYRCPQAVVEEANNYVKDIQAFKQGGKVQKISEFPDKIPYGSLVLSGHYKHLMSLFLEKRLQGDKVALRGHNFVEAALTEAKKSHKTPYDVSFARLVQASKVKIEEKAAKCTFTLAGLEQKKHLDTVQATLDLMSHTFTDLAQAETFAGQVTKTSGADYVFSTIHRCKGSESDNVYFLNYNEYSEQALAGDIETRRLTYVGVTRAKNNLFLVN